MAFKLRSGNTTNFKQMGSSPLKASANYSDKAQNLLKAVPNKDEYNKLSDVDKQGFDKAAEKYGLPTKKESPAKQRVVKEGEGQDQDKIFNKKGEHIGDYVNGKKVMHTKAQHAKLMKSTKSAHGQLEDAERDSKADSRKKSPAKQTDTTYADGSKKSQREQDFSKRHTDEKAKNKYWYKINGQGVSKEAYIKYENKPGGDESGKQTNNPDVYGRKANNHGRGPKTK